MQGDPKVIEYLNEQLTAELTAINQYFLHSKMQQNWGFTKLAAYTRDESIPATSVTASTLLCAAGGHPESQAGGLDTHCAE